MDKREDAKRAKFDLARLASSRSRAPR